MGAKERNERYRTKHPERMKEYYLKNKDKIVANVTAWRKNNPDKVKAIVRRAGLKFRKTPKSIWHDLQQNSKKRGHKIILSQSDFLVWHKKQVRECHYCGIGEENIARLKELYPYHKFISRRLTVDRKNNLLGYTLTNIVLACEACNGIKGNILDEDLMLQISTILRNRRIENGI